MHSLLEKALDTYERRGAVALASSGTQYVYNRYVRGNLPRKTTEYNGVSVRAERLFDSVIPFQLGHPNPQDYEAAIVRSLKEHIEEGDSVVIVGGGWGVSTVVAAELAGPTGHVDTYEGAADYCDYIAETVRLNGVNETVSIHHTIVGEEISLRGESRGATVLSPKSLSECDILVLDCEGAEKQIIEGMNCNPGVVVAETHGIFGSPTPKVRDVLESKAYETISLELAETGPLSEKCVENDIRVLTAVKSR